MKILEKRPLALILCIMLGGFSFSIDLAWKTKLIVSVVPLIIIGAIFIFDGLKSGRKHIVYISLISLSVSLLLSLLWTLTFFPTRYFGKNVSIEAKVYDLDNTGASSTVITCKTSKIDGKKDKRTFILYLNKDKSNDIKKYDVVSFNATIKELPRQDDGFDGRSYYLSNGYSAILTESSDIEIKENKVDKFDSFFKNLRLKISNKLKLRTDFQTGAFLSALIVGDRKDLSGNTRLNFSRLGISHILALSGMHLAILSLALDYLLKQFYVKKKIRVALMSSVVLFYIALTGFSSSVLRSGFMVVITGILFLLSRKSDAITSLLISVALIVCFDPVAVFDLSLWLSAFATLGVITFSEIAQMPDKNTSRPKKLWILFKNGCLASVFAFAATFVFTALRFDSFSVVSIFTTLMFSFIIQLFIYGGLLVILIGGIIPIGKLLVLLSYMILNLAEFISSFRFVFVSMNSLVVKILIIALTVFFFAFLILEIKNKSRGIAIILILMISTFAAAEIDTLITRYDDSIRYTPSTSGDIMLLKSEGDATAIYSGKAFSDSSWDILDTLYEEGLTYVDNFVFTSYSYTSIDFTDNILRNIKVKKLLLPTPETSSEVGQAEGLSYLLSEYGTDMEFYDCIDYISFGNYKYRLFNKVDYIYGAYPESVYEIVCDEKSITYLSVCDYGSLSPSAKHFLFNSKNLIVGSIGNTRYYTFDMRLPEVDIIYYYDEGRLTEEATNYYKNKGVPMHLIKTPVEIYD